MSDWKDTDYLAASTAFLGLVLVALATAQIIQWTVAISIGAAAIVAFICIARIPLIKRLSPLRWKLFVLSTIAAMLCIISLYSITQIMNEFHKGQSSKVITPIPDTIPEIKKFYPASQGGIYLESPMIASSDIFNICQNKSWENFGIRISVLDIRNEGVHYVVYGTVDTIKGGQPNKFTAIQRGTCMEYSNNLAIWVKNVLTDSKCAQFQVIMSQNTNTPPCKVSTVKAVKKMETKETVAEVSEKQKSSSPIIVIPGKLKFEDSDWNNVQLVEVKNTSEKDTFYSIWLKIGVDFKNIDILPEKDNEFFVQNLGEVLFNYGVTKILAIDVDQKPCIFLVIYRIKSLESKFFKIIKKPAKDNTITNNTSSLLNVVYYSDKPTSYKWKDNSISLSFNIPIQFKVIGIANLMTIGKK